MNTNINSINNQNDIPACIIITDIQTALWCTLTALNDVNNKVMAFKHDNIKQDIQPYWTFRHEVVMIAGVTMKDKSHHINNTIIKDINWFIISGLIARALPILLLDMSGLKSRPSCISFPWNHSIYNECGNYGEIQKWIITEDGDTSLS